MERNTARCPALRSFTENGQVPGCSFILSVDTRHGNGMASAIELPVTGRPRLGRLTLQNVAFEGDEVMRTRRLSYRRRAL